MPISRPALDWSDDPADDDDPRAADDGDASDGAVSDGAVSEDDDDDDSDDDSDLDPDARARLDADFPLGDGVAEDAATVWCPYCGEPSEVAVDPGGGAHQTYVEDCPVCCRPWRVTVSYGPDGRAEVWAQTDDE